MTPPVAGTVTAKKAVARVALVELNAATSAILTDCFKQFGIKTVQLSDPEALQRLHKEKLEAMVLRLDARAEELLEAARSSPSNRRIVIYGIAAGAQAALKYSRFGINTVLSEPVERQSALRVVRATHLLVVHELRRYVRIPVVTEVALRTDTRRIVGQTQEISGGGMSVRVSGKFAVGDSMDIMFDLPKRPGIKIGGTVCWIRVNDSLVGLRFLPDDERRVHVKEWIDDYLEIS